jgi:NADH-quinone oxidoreductase subunit N
MELNMFIPDWSDMRHWVPELVLCGAFLAALIGDLLFRGKRPAVSFGISVFGLITAGSYAVAGVLRADPVSYTILGQLIVVDGLAGFFRLLFIFTGLVTVLFAWTSEEIMGKGRRNKGEFYAMTVMMTAAMCVMAEAQDLLMFFLSLEAVSLVSYVMAGYMRGSLRSTEAGLKYVLFGAVSSGIMLYGLSLLYGMTGSMSFAGIGAALNSGAAGSSGNPFGLLVAVILIFAGVSYKIAAVPFHFWCPDVYEGAPTPVSALFSVGPKAAGFALTIRFFFTTLAGERLVADINWPLLVAAISAATMTYGNLVALRQDNVKRMLAYSSIAHVGYLLMGFVLLTGEGLAAILFYLLVYTFMNLGAFFFVTAVNNHLKSEDLRDYVGLGFRLPWAGAMMVVFLASLTGIPPFAGFPGKFYLFTAAIDKQLFWLVIVAAVNSVISLYYYFKVAKAMFLMRPEEGAETGPLKLHWLQYVVLGVLAVPTIGLGLFFGEFKELADTAVRLMQGM